MEFWQKFNEAIGKSPKRFWSKSETFWSSPGMAEESSIYFNNWIFPWNTCPDTVNGFFDNPAEFFCWKQNLSVLKIRKSWKKNYSCQKCLLFKLVFGKHGMQFLQLCWTVFVEVRKFFCSKFQINDSGYKIFEKTLFLPNVHLDTQKGVWQIFRRNFGKVGTFS